MSMNTNLKFRKSSLLLFSFLLFFCFLATLYFKFNTLGFYSGLVKNTSVINWHDHEVYVEYIEYVARSDFLVEINNNVGIALIYGFLGWVFPDLLLDDNYLYLSFFVNILILVLIYFLYNSICNKLVLPVNAKYFLFFYFPLIYFSQLINKDNFTLLALFLVLRLALSSSRKTAYVLILIIIPFLMLIRLQLGVFALIFLTFLFFKKFKLIFFVLYCVTAFTGAWLSLHGGYIEVETFGSGMTAFLRNWNGSYFYTGFLIFNPIRVVQYFEAMYLSFFVINEGQFDWARFLNIPSVIILSFYWKYIFKAFLNIKLTYNTELKPIMILILSFMLTWLMNPTVNTRYVMLVVPFLFILGVAFKYRKKEI